jgi:DNA-binding beta-propeller fold protein YncE
MAPDVSNASASESVVDSGSDQATRSTKQRVWVALESASALAKVDVARRRVVRRISTAGAPHNLTVGGGGTAVATLPGAGRIVIVRSGNTRTVRLGGAPHDVKVARGVAVVANEGAARLDRVFLNGRVGRRIPLRANPHDLTLSPRGKTAWVTLDGSDDIAIVNLVRRRVRRYLSTGKSPHDIAFAPDGKRIWVTDWNGAVHVFRRRGVRVRTIERGVELHHLAFTPDGREVWVTDGGGERLLIISAKSLVVRASRRVDGSPHHVAVTRDGRRAVVALNDEGKLGVFAVGTRRRLRALRVGRGPHGVGRAP